MAPKIAVVYVSSFLSSLHILFCPVTTYTIIAYALYGRNYVLKNPKCDFWLNG